MLKTKRHSVIVGIIALWMIVHLVLRWASPAALALISRSEVIAHIAVLGIAVTAIRNRIGWWKKPTYGDDGLLSLENAGKITGTSYEVLPNQWDEIGYIVAEFILYVALWSWILKLWHR
jgi:hypothetical protein